MEAGASVNLLSRGWNSMSPLHICAQSNRVQNVKLLLHYGANVFLRDRGGFTSRERAKNVECEQVLQEHEGDFSLEYSEIIFSSIFSNC